MWKSFVCRHRDVEWLDSYRCSCSACGKYGHYFEQGYVIWTRASKRPLEAEDAEVAESELFAHPVCPSGRLAEVALTEVGAGLISEGPFDMERRGSERFEGESSTVGLTRPLASCAESAGEAMPDFPAGAAKNSRAGHGPLSIESRWIEDAFGEVDPCAMAVH